MKTISRQVDSLNGIRGIAVLIVILSHTSNRNLFLWDHLDFSATGQYGVMIFFFLSSFLLSRPFFQNNQLIKNPQEWVGYVIRRILRIIPLYYLVLLADFFIFKRCFNGSDIKALTGHFMFSEGCDVYWTMPIEMKFYFILPFLVVALILSSRKKIIFWSLISAILLSFVVNVIYANTNSIMETLFLHRYIPCFISGFLISYLFAITENRSFSQKNKLLFESLAFVCILISITQIPSVWSFLNGEPYVFRPEILGDFYKYRLFMTIILISIFVYGLLKGLGKIKSFLSSRIMQTIGNCSYSMYLIHMFIVDYFVKQSHLPSSLRTVLIFIVTFLISLITYRLIEKPFIKLAKITSNRLIGVSSRTKGENTKVTS